MNSNKKVNYNVIEFYGKKIRRVKIIKQKHFWFDRYEEKKVAYEDYEKDEELWKRINEWLLSKNAKVINFETLIKQKHLGYDGYLNYFTHNYTFNGNQVVGYRIFYYTELESN
jgi:hypothetical protein